MCRAVGQYFERFLHCVRFSFVCSSILKKHAASIFRVTALVQVDAEVMGWNKMCQSCGKGSVNLANHSCGTAKGGRTCPKPMGVENCKNGSFEGLNQGLM